MSILNQLKNELNQLGIKPKKGLGQNFLVNEGIYIKIIDALDLKPGNTIVEVGPGLGTLTQLLADTGARVIAVEKDHLLANYLKTKFANQKNAQPFAEAGKNIASELALPLQQKTEFRTENLKPTQTLSKFSGARVTILEGDILQFKIEKLKFKTATYKLVGNIPYYLTSHLLRTVLEKWPQPEYIVLMLQKEVAQRICAKPPDMSLLAVSVQYYSIPKIVSYVSRGSFYPPPEVDSAIVRLESTRLPARQGIQIIKSRIDTKNFFRVVKAGFTGKRKQLANNLSSSLKLEKSLVEEKLKSISIDPKRRAETLTLEEWQSIVTTLLPY